MNKNKSSIYGFYGGVAPANHYVPPPAAEFIPQPSQVTSITETDRLILQQLVQQTEFFTMNAGDILLRTNVTSTSDNVDTFVLSTSAKPDDVIIYTSENDNFNLNIMDGGQF